MLGHELLIILVITGAISGLGLFLTQNKGLKATFAFFASTVMLICGLLVLSEGISLSTGNLNITTNIDGDVLVNDVYNDNSGLSTVFGLMLVLGAISIIMITVNFLLKGKGKFKDVDID
jgi:hypothetical protein